MSNKDDELRVLLERRMALAKEALLPKLQQMADDYWAEDPPEAPGGLASLIKGRKRANG